jgi:hypothetical protein
LVIRAHPEGQSSIAFSESIHRSTQRSIRGRALPRHLRGDGFGVGEVNAAAGLPEGSTGDPHDPNFSIDDDPNSV